MKQAGALLALVLLALGSALLPGQALFQRDVHLMWYTQVETLVAAVAHGHWPLWNPYLSFGQPLWADANTQPLYPFTLLHVVLRPWTWYVVYVAAHLWLAGLGTAALARRLGASAPAALVAGAVALLSGPVLSLVCTWNQLAGAAWMPWAAACAVSALRRPSRGRLAAWAACLAAPVLAGSPEGLLMGAVLTLACAWGRLGLPRASSMRPVVGTAAAAALLAAALSAGQWLPSLEAARRSARGTLTAEARGHWSVTPALLGQALVPAPLSTLPLAPEMRTRLFAGRDAFLASLYLGLPALVLVAAPLSPRRRRLRHALAATGILALLFSLGPFTPVYGWAMALPGLSALRYPAKAMVLVAVCWGLLAGLGLDGWRRALRLHPPAFSAPGAAAKHRLAFVTGLLVAAVAAAWLAASAWRAQPALWASILSVGASSSWRAALWPLTIALLVLAVACAAMAFALFAHGRGRRWSLPALGLVPVLDLLAAHHGLNPTAPVALFTHPPALVEDLGDLRGARLLSYDYFSPGASERLLGREVAYLPVRGPVGWSLPAVQALALRQYLFPPVAGAWRIAGSFDQDVSGFGIAEVARLTTALREVEARPDALLNLLQLGAVTHVVALHERGWDSLVPAGTWESLFPEPLRLFRVPGAFPRAYLAVPRAVDALPVPALIPAPALGAARIAEISTDGLTIDVDATAEAELVIVDAYDPHWTASVDGVRVPVRRANLAFRAVRVGPGRHRVEMSYRPWPVFAGLGVTLAALLGTAWLAFPSALRRGGRA